jgi:hypothetical protein
VPRSKETYQRVELEGGVDLDVGAPSLGPVFPGDAVVELMVLAGLAEGGEGIAPRDPSKLGDPPRVRVHLFVHDHPLRES